MISGPVLFAVIVGSTYSQEASRAVFTAGTCALMAFWWILEAIPLPITALLPLVIACICVLLLTCVGVVSIDRGDGWWSSCKLLSQLYGVLDDRWILHSHCNGKMESSQSTHISFHTILILHSVQRIATKIVLIFGVKPRNLLFGLMFATYFSSFWVSNTAATMMVSISCLCTEWNTEHALRCYLMQQRSLLNSNKHWHPKKCQSFQRLFISDWRSRVLSVALLL